MINNVHHIPQPVLGQVRLTPTLPSVIYIMYVTIATLAVHVQQAGAAHVIQQLVDLPQAKEITDMLIEVIPLFYCLMVTMVIDVSGTTPTICHGQQLTL